MSRTGNQRRKAPQLQVYEVAFTARVLVAAFSEEAARAAGKEMFEAGLADDYFQVDSAHPMETYPRGWTDRDPLWLRGGAEEDAAVCAAVGITRAQLENHNPPLGDYIDAGCAPLLRGPRICCERARPA